MASGNAAAIAAGLQIPECTPALSPDSRESVVAHSVLQFSHTHDNNVVTWSMLDRANATLSAKVRRRGVLWTA